MLTHRIIRQPDLRATGNLYFFEDGFFFNTPEHLCQQGSYGSRTIVAQNRRTRRTEARCTFFLESNRATSPSAAPFGSVEFNQALPDAVLNSVLDALIDEAEIAGASLLRIVNYPHCYAPRQAHRLTGQLLLRKFQVVSAEQNFHLPISSDLFSTLIDSSERRRLQKCRRSGFQFGHWTDPDLDAVVSFLVRTRQQQAYPLTLPPNRLCHLLRTFPNQFPVFAVHDGATVAALTVAVRVRNDILYNFLPASNPDYNTYSPMVLLTDGLFSYCQQQHITLLDLGVSLDSNRQPKPSLMQFKRRLGAHESPKLAFEKML